ncbi:cadherin-like beta sandwich domain-containing protein, partial [Mucilaginibacter gilvus]
SSASTISLTLTAQDAGSVIRVNGSTVASGVASAPITLTGASTPIDVLVTAENGTSTKTYRITVLKGLSGNAYLSKIATNPLSPLAQVSGPADLNYTATVGSSASTISLTLTAQDAGSAIKINGTTVASGVASGPITLTGASTPIDVLVTAENGTTTKTYRITAVKGLSDNAYLSKIATNPLSPLTQVSGPADLNYTATVGSLASTISLT